MQRPMGWSLAAAAILSVADASAGPFDKVSPDAAPKWSTGCESGKTAQFGDAKEQYCYLMFNNYHIREQLMEGNSYLIKMSVLMYIDQRGLRLNAPKKADRLCNSEPKRIAVDGMRIDELPPREQVDRVLSGRMLVWEQQADWPYCGVAPHGTNLHGLPAAVEKLKQEWEGISNAWSTTVVR